MINIYTKSILVLQCALAVSIECDEFTPRAHCCTLYKKVQFLGEGQSFCTVFKSDTEQQVFDLRGLESIHTLAGENGSIKCGSQASVTVCPADYEFTEVDGVKRIVCSGQKQNVIEVGANESLSSVSLKDSSIILNYWPWAAKGPTYLALDRERKFEILWEKILEDPTIGKNNMREIANIDLLTTFDTQGDEFDCRHKTVHSQGNIAKVVWKDPGDHNYTGMFKGADTGFVRTSDTMEPIKDRTG